MPFNSVHFIGIKGTGMSAVAQVLASQGVRVTGSDVTEEFPTDRGLATAGIAVQPGFSPAHVDEPDCAVVSAAFGSENPEVAECIRRRIPLLTYPEFLGMLMEDRRVIAVAGTHGKTTTTAMVGAVLRQAGVDPTVVIGSGDAWAGRSDLLVAECCEYRRHFLHYRPEIALITSIELDHPDYYASVDDVFAAFQEFVDLIPGHGLLIVHGDDPHAAKLVSKAKRVTYGFGGGNDYHCRSQRIHDGRSDFTVTAGGRRVGEFTLPVSGRHNVLNATAAIAAACELGLDPRHAAQALAEFCNVSRRFEYVGEYRGALVYDDYAHHPTAIAVTLQGAREFFPDRRLWVVFQPHTYTRTQRLLTEFATALGQADHIILAEVFSSAREQDGTAKVSSLDLARRVPGWPERVEFIAEQADIVRRLRQDLPSDALLLTMGAGDIYRVAGQLVHHT
ncbi:MAG: UDP-N-acetylmuramate--L-alanine ligase [Bacillota bacterium]